MVTLWAESAIGFQEAALKSLAPPMFIALIALKVNQYQGSTGSTMCFFNPNIPQFTEYKQRFQYLNLPVEILPSSAERYAKPHVTADSELKTIEELLLLDPTLNKDTKFMCRATIVGFDLSKGWWYKSCPSCHKVAKKMSADFKFKINFIVEDNTNQFNLMMIGRQAEKTFGCILPLPCHRRRDQPPSATTTSSVELCTPAANVEKQIVNAATPASFVPLEPCAQEIQLPTSNKTVKRALFVESEAAKKQSKTCEESQPQSTILARILKEFSKPVIPKIEPLDKVPISALRSRSQTKKLKERHNYGALF
ncbi:hypothetical protein C1H46_025621 [Malus baccata]|uniref:Replication factor A C-terminal domain-containing protein n=1 Tax=Malus baccata TaxID=106549 RepID=A0A540LR00_MALBA|nr:hypothetical protein C1H46_025621 [Malus baccata]